MENLSVSGTYDTNLLRCTGEISYLMDALNLYTRLQCGQFMFLPEVIGEWKPQWPLWSAVPEIETLLNVRRAPLGIHSPSVEDNARIAYDIFQTTKYSIDVFLASKPDVQNKIPRPYHPLLIAAKMHSDIIVDIMAEGDNLLLTLSMDTNCLSVIREAINLAIELEKGNLGAGIDAYVHGCPGNKGLTDDDVSIAKEKISRLRTEWMSSRPSVIALGTGLLKKILQRGA